jgi:hypothetical protein
MTASATRALPGAGGCDSSLNSLGAQPVSPAIVLAVGRSVLGRTFHAGPKRRTLYLGASHALLFLDGLATEGELPLGLALSVPNWEFNQGRLQEVCRPGREPPI